MKRVALLVLLVGATLGATELYARIGLGLGDPPLSVRDPEVDYYLKPSGDYRRFGMDFHVNSVGMRASEPPRQKGPCDIRILAIGDSVLNGGAVVDQKVIATSLLEKDLSQTLHRQVWVGNAAAGGWAPENMLAYTNKFGWFDADAVIFVLSTHDLHQRAAFARDLGPNFPLTRPWFATSEGIVRYLPRYLPFLAPYLAPVPEDGVAQAAAPDREAEEILARLIATARQRTDFVLVLHNRTVDEVAGHQTPEDRADAQKLAAVVRAAGAHYIDMYEAEKNGWNGQALHRDGIHLNAAGQAYLASAITDAISGKLKQIVEAQPASCTSR